MILSAVVLAILLPAASALAQNDESFSPEPEVAADPALDPPPLTLRENYSYTANQIFGVPEILRMAGRAAIDHIEDAPKGWGPGYDGYALRFGSHLGVAMVRENIAFGIRALDGEDPRYARLGKGPLWKRVGYAAERTFLVRRSNGGLMPAWSLLIANYSTPFIAQQWRPDGTMGGRELRTGSIGVGLSVTQNLYLEFWPDVKKKFHR